MQWKPLSKITAYAPDCSIRIVGGQDSALGDTLDGSPAMLAIYYNFL